MKSLWALILGLILTTSLSRSADSNADNNAAADAAWADILKSAQPPAPPAEWNKKRPTEEEMAAFKNKAGDAAETLADQIKKFYETYPDHPKAAEARDKEKVFRKQAVALHSVKATQPADNKAKPAQQNDNEEMDPKFKERYLDAMAKIRSAKPLGPRAVIAALEQNGRELAKDFPKRSEPWEMLYSAAQYNDATNALGIYKLIAEGAPDAKMKDAAQTELKSLGRLNKPLTLAYKSVDGRDVDLAKMKGKVVLVDFWATWCGPCVAEVPNVVKTYQELHEQGFEIVGVSFDEDCDDMKKFVAKNKMPWPQFCDGGGWQNSINKEFGIRAIPSMYLVDKKGVLRDMNARENLAEKVRALLAEKE